MPFCPTCKFQYKDGIQICPDCGATLVASLPDRDDEAPQYTDWVEVARLTSPQYAQMVVEAFRSQEIPVVVLSGAGYFGELGHFGIPSFRPVGGGYTVVVPSEFVREADTEGTALLGDLWEKSKLIDIADDEQE